MIYNLVLEGKIDTFEFGCEVVYHGPEDEDYDLIPATDKGACALSILESHGSVKEWKAITRDIVELREQAKKLEWD